MEAETRIEVSAVDDVGVRWLRAMRRGDFGEAWRQTDRLEAPRRASEAAGTFQREPHHLLWNGDAFEDRRVLVRCNHGLGDTIQFARYVPLLQPIARSTTLLAQPHLVDLLARCGDYAEVRNGWTNDPPPPHDVEIEIMELPYAFRSTVDTLPAKVPYLRVDHLRGETPPPLRAIDDHVLHVGLVWASSDWDLSRSIPLSLLAALARSDGVRFYSLQQGRFEGAWRDAPLAIVPLSRHTADIASLAAAMLRLDLVVTVDCMVAHLAGALARPVWMLLLQECDWRWMEHRADSPWYPTMRLFRQPKRGDWVSVVEDVAAALGEVVRSRSARFVDRRTTQSRCDEVVKGEGAHGPRRP